MVTAGRGAVLVAVLVVGAAAVPLVGPAVVASGGGVAVAQETTPANETVRHEDPSSVNEGGNPGMVEGYLTDQLVERLGNSTVSISQGQYEAARESLGESYQGQLGRYVDVAGDTGSEADDRSASSFETAGALLGNFSDRLAAFNESERAYRAASNAGNDRRARHAARRLIERARAVNETGTALIETYVTIQNQTGRNLTESRHRIENVTRGVMDRAAAVRAASFVQTRVTATVPNESVSFREPAIVRGRLTDLNGTGLEGRPVLVGNASEAVAVETNETGWFEATYRPALLPAAPGVVPVRYVPTGGSTYLGNRTNVSVDVNPIRPTLTARADRTAAAYGDRLIVRGAMWADQHQIPGVPVVVTIGGVRLDRVQTGPFGWYVASGEVPAAVPPGEQPIHTRLGVSGRSIVDARASDRLSVASTETGISLAATLHENETLVVDGRLRTAGGDGVEGQPVALRTGEMTATTVETNGSGAFSAALGPGEYTVGSEGVVTVTAQFGGAGTNLESSTAQRSLAAPWVQDASGDGSVAWLVGLMAVLLALVTAAIVWWRRDRWFDTAGDVADAAARGGDETTPTDAGRTGTATDWREVVTARLSAGEPDRAVEAAYGFLRRRLATELDLGGALTHWEVYAACAEDGLAPERVEAIRAVTEAYERARFAPGALTADEAREAVEGIERAVE